jgi:hypothetical protein
LRVNHYYVFIYFYLIVAEPSLVLDGIGGAF